MLALDMDMEMDIGEPWLSRRADDVPLELPHGLQL
jgi:hypothetical protein